jgi:hypothetical protein
MAFLPGAESLHAEVQNIGRDGDDRDVQRAARNAESNQDAAEGI